MCVERCDTIGLPRRALRGGARPRGHHPGRGRPVRLSRLCAHRDAHPGGDGRPAGRRTGAGHPLQVLRLPGRSSGHAPGRYPADRAHVRHASGRRARPLALPLHPARLSRGRDGEPGAGPRAHPVRRGMHRGSGTGGRCRDRRAVRRGAAAGRSDAVRARHGYGRGAPGPARALRCLRAVEGRGAGRLSQLRLRGPRPPVRCRHGARWGR